MYFIQDLKWSGKVAAIERLQVAAANFGKANSWNIIHARHPFILHDMRVRKEGARQLEEDVDG